MQPLDESLDVDERQLLSDFHEFYKDVFTELESRYGRVRGLRCCQNAAEHLRGSVYVQFDTPDEAVYQSALEGCQGRWYAGKQVNCRLAYLGAGWKGAACGAFASFSHTPSFILFQVASHLRLGHQLTQAIRATLGDK